MGVVYLATTPPERKVALKLLAPELAEDAALPGAVPARVRARRLARPPERDPDLRGRRADGLLYIAMRYVEGTDLKGLLDERAARAARGALGSSGRSPTRWMQPTSMGSSTVTSSPANILIAGQARPRARLPVRLRPDQTSLHRRRPRPRPASSSAPPTTSPPSRSNGARSTAAPTSTRSPASSTRSLTGEAPYRERLADGRPLVTRQRPAAERYESESRTPRGDRPVHRERAREEPSDRYSTAMELVRRSPGRHSASRASLLTPVPCSDGAAGRSLLEQSRWSPWRSPSRWRSWEAKRARPTTTVRVGPNVDSFADRSADEQAGRSGRYRRIEGRHHRAGRRRRGRLGREPGQRHAVAGRREHEQADEHRRRRQLAPTTSPSGKTPSGSSAPEAGTALWSSATPRLDTSAERSRFRTPIR